MPEDAVFYSCPMVVVRRGQLLVGPRLDDTTDSQLLLESSLPL